MTQSSLGSAIGFRGELWGGPVAEPKEREEDVLILAVQLAKAEGRRDWPAFLPEARKRLSGSES
jgi:hypothetical protein